MYFAINGAVKIELLLALFSFAILMQINVEIDFNLSAVKMQYRNWQRNAKIKLARKIFSENS